MFLKMTEKPDDRKFMVAQVRQAKHATARSTEAGVSYTASEPLKEPQPEGQPEGRGAEEPS